MLLIASRNKMNVMLVAYREMGVSGIESKYDMCLHFYAFPSISPELFRYSGNLPHYELVLSVVSMFAQ
jgi:hypothetical protein